MTGPNCVSVLKAAAVQSSRDGYTRTGTCKGGRDPFVSGEESLSSDPFWVSTGLDRVEVVRSRTEYWYPDAVFNGSWECSGG